MCFCILVQKQNKKFRDLKFRKFKAFFSIVFIISKVHIDEINLKRFIVKLILVESEIDQCFFDKIFSRRTNIISSILY